MQSSAKLLAIYFIECQRVSTLGNRVLKVKEGQTSPRYHFTALKSSTLIGFSTLPYESANVVALYRANVVAWQRGNIAQHHHSKAPYHTNHALTPEPIRARQAGSWQLERKLQAA